MARHWALLATTLAVLSSGCSSSEPDPFAHRLAESLGGGRIVEPRLGVGFEYRPCTEGGEDLRLPRVECSPLPAPGTRGFAETARLGLELRSEMAVAPDPEVLRIAGVLNVVWRDVSPGSLNAAIGQLERAVAASSGDATILSTLAAAYIVLSEHTQDPSDLLRALEAAERAVSAAPAMHEAAYNRALILERLALYFEATEAWRGYLARDPDSEWGREAARRLDALQSGNIGATIDELSERILAGRARPGDIAELVALSPLDARELALDRLLPEWATRARPEWTIGNHWFNATEALGRELVRVGGDHSVAEAVATIRVADGLGREVREALTRGHITYGRGAAHLASREYEPALPLFVEAAQQLRRADAGRVADWAEYFQAITLHYRGDYEGATELIDSIEESLRGALGWEALGGRLNQLRATIHLRRLRHEDAADRARVAIGLYEAAGERISRGSAEVLLGDALDAAGAYDQATRALHRGSRLLQATPAIVWRHNLAFLLGLAAERAGLERSLIRLRGESVRTADAMGVRQYRAEARLLRAVSLQRIGDEVDAMTDLTEARRFHAQMSSGLMKERIGADLSLAEGTLLVRTEPERAVELLRGAHAYYGERRLGINLLPAEVQLARASLHVGDSASAEQGLRASGELALQFAFGWDTAAERSVALRAHRDVFLDLARLELAIGDTTGALLAVELTRATALSGPLLERIDARALTDFELLAHSFRQAVRDAVGSLSSSVVASYATLGDETLIWRVDSEGGDRVMVVETPDLPDRVGSFRAATRIEAAEESARELSRLLVAPVVDPPGASGSSFEELVFVPDGPLHQLPFSVLPDAAGRPIFASHVVRSLPSTTYLSPRRETGPPASVLTVGDPRAPGWRRLPGAEREADEVRALYPRGAVVSGSDATRSAVLDAVQEHEVFHFAGHAVARGLHPDSSYIVLAGAPEGTRVTPRAMAAASPSHLVVLSACRTVADDPEGSFGPSWFAVELIAGGSRGVVTSLWEVDDAQTADFMVRFHEALSVHGDPGRALATAQREAATGTPGVPAETAWQAFVYIGN